MRAFWLIALIFAGTLWLGDDLRGWMVLSLKSLWTEMTEFALKEGNEDAIKLYGPIVAAFVGFFGGTVTSHMLEARRDRLSARREVAGIREAVQGELVANAIYLSSKQYQLRTIGDDIRRQFGDDADTVLASMDLLARTVQAISQPPSRRVFEGHTKALGRLGAANAFRIITTHAYLHTEHEKICSSFEQRAKDEPIIMLLAEMKERFSDQEHAAYDAHDYVKPKSIFAETIWLLRKEQRRPEEGEVPFTWKLKHWWRRLLHHPDDV